MAKVSLDALIPREDFEVEDNSSPGKKKETISIDHKQRRQDGGLANIDNGQLTHPYCNTGYKN